MVGFSTNPQKETDWRPGCIQGVKNIEIKWESCLIINHSIWKSGFNGTGIKTWTIAARNRRRSYSITGVFWGAFHIQASPPPSPPSSPSPAVSDVHKVRLSRKSWEECKDQIPKHPRLGLKDKFYLHDERAVFIAVLIQGVQLSNGVVKCLNKQIGKQIPQR